jgi:hypothetical protein
MSKIEVNTVDVQCGSTLTLGSSGKTVKIACGASTVGMGRTGTVDWCTTAKTSPFTAVSGDGFFVDTSSGAVTVTLPASPSAGDIVSIADYTNTFQTNNVTIGRNGSKIGGVCADAILSTQGQSITLVYVDGTEGWKNVQDSTSNVTGNPGFVSATGGTITTSGDFKIHTFTGDGCFAVTNTFGSGVGAKVSYVVVAGGGGGTGAGGGAGGFREGKQACGGYTASPLAATPCSGLPVSVQTYPITVGGGGAGANPGYTGVGKADGSNSIFSTITSTGGGAGGTSPTPSPGGDGGDGGSGGGSGNTPSGTAAAGSGNTPPVSPPQGNNGGTSSPGPGAMVGMGGGGGAGAVGTNGTQNPANPNPGSNAGSGGNGVASSITGSPVTKAGGGGGAAQSPPGTSNADLANGGTGGGGSGSVGGIAPSVAATVNSGGGGGGAVGNPSCLQAGSGGSGIVIIRYKFQ